MRKLTVNGKEEGQRLDKYLKRKLPQAPMSFFYKMLRKKNITLNGKKADGRETVQAGDLVTLFLADETIAKFRGETVSGREREDQIRAVIDASDRIRGVTVLYEDDNVLVCTKPFGVLSQKAGPEDLSMNEWLAGHLLKKSKDPAALLDSFREFRPSVCNRLDRNTMGLIVCAVSLPGSRTMTELIRTRKLRKFYQMVVEGRLTGSGTIRGWLVKDPATNKVSFSDREIPGAVFSETKWKSLSANGARSLIEAELVTGRSHQLRVQFAHMGHPIPRPAPLQLPAGIPAHGGGLRAPVRKSDHMRPAAGLSQGSGAQRLTAKGEIYGDLVIQRAQGICFRGHDQPDQ